MTIRILLTGHYLPCVIVDTFSLLPLFLFSWLLIEIQLVSQQGNQPRNIKPFLPNKDKRFWNSWSPSTHSSSGDRAAFHHATLQIYSGTQPLDPEEKWTKAPYWKDMFRERPVSTHLNIFVGILQLFCTGKHARRLGDVQHIYEVHLEAEHRKQKQKQKIVIARKDRIHGFGV
jgi:hypothetical protein